MNWKDDSKFPGRLRQVREKAGLSQSEFAEQVGVSRGAISTYELGDRVPDIRFLDTVIEKFGCSYDYLMGKAETAMSKEAAESALTDLNDEALEVIAHTSAEINELAKMSPDLLRSMIAIPAIYAMGSAYFQLLAAADRADMQSAFDFFGRGSAYWNIAARDFFESAKMAGYQKLSDDDRQKIREIVSESMEMGRSYAVDTGAPFEMIRHLTDSCASGRLDGFTVLELKRLDEEYGKRNQ